MMWGADNDGDPVFGEYTDEIVNDPDNWPEGWIKSAPDAHGIFFLNYPEATGSKPTTLSYNWWSGFETPEYDFGPRHRENIRDFRTGGIGWPWGDANRYHVMSNGEIDYDVHYTSSIGSFDSIWIPPPTEIALMASTRGLPAPPNLLSVGPYDLPPGAGVQIPFAFVGGEDLHVDPDNNAVNLPHNPNKFYANLDFSNLLQTATWARWIYDNPGVDTDGDEYAGEFAICEGDTVYYTGDGIPDWRGAVPPPPPDLWLTPIANGIHVRFNGTRSETEKDAFSGKVEFEGYRIYCGRDERSSSMALTASYDIENYDKYMWGGVGDSLAYVLSGIPFSLDSLRCLYGSGEYPCDDDNFDPLSYTKTSPYVHPDFKDSIFYFVGHDYNASVPGVTTPIRKVYPDEPNPYVHYGDSIPPEAFTADDGLKYFEYEFTLENLLPTIPHWINVTSFDFGQPALGIEGMESSLAIGAKSAFPLGLSDATSDGNSRVYVYPNPYRSDGGYREDGFEGRTEENRPDYRVREIHFANLPPKCSIQIYSLDGDLIRELDHDCYPSDPNSGHESWDMISRNTQMIVSGLYYWVVEAEDGSTQMGKFVVIM